MKPRSALHRLTVVDGNVMVDPARIAARSAYLCRDPSCWELAEKRRALDRALGIRTSARDWERLHQGILI